jgi:ketosteroid isomerase-like protein
MATEDSRFLEALERVRAALAAMGSGDPEPYIRCWAEPRVRGRNAPKASEDVTLFGAWGPIEKGCRKLTETFRWVASRFKGGQLVPENTVAFASGDLAYTVGSERGEVVVDGGAPQTMVIRVTHVYRRFGGEWRLVHRHADFPPADQRRGFGGVSPPMLMSPQ